MTNDQKLKTGKKSFPYWLFAVIFIVASLMPMVMRQFSSARATFTLKDNQGMGRLIATPEAIVAAFSDGQVAAWDWAGTDKALWQYAAGTDRVVMLDDNRLAGVNRTGRKFFFVADIRQEKKLSSISVGLEDQDVWLIQSPDRKQLALARITSGKSGQTLYEWMMMDPSKSNPELPVSVELLKDKRLIAFALSNDCRLLAVGSSGKKGIFVVADMNQGKVILEKEIDNAQEFTSAAFTPDGSRVFLTSRNGLVYGVDTVSGEVRNELTVLKPGEKNPVTGETRSDGIVISADGRTAAAVVINVVHVWDIQTGKHIQALRPGHKLTGSIALSQDGLLLATSDIRAGGSVRLWQIKK